MRLENLSKICKPLEIEALKPFRYYAILKLNS
jgi:hypothetical protein